MANFLNQVATPEWWLSVVIVGILINLFSNFLTPPLQAKFGHLSRRWAERNEVLAKQRAARIERIANSDHELYLAHFHLNELRLDCIFSWVLAVSFLGFGAAAKDFASWAYTLFILFAALNSVEGMRMTIKHGQESLLVTEAKHMNLDRKHKASKAENEA